MQAYGHKTWFVPDAYYPSKSHNFPSHEAVCVINTSDTDAVISFTLLFEDQDKVEGFTSSCPAGRTHHIRMDKLRNADGNGVPQDKSYAIIVESNVNIVAQYSRMDTSQSEMALMTTIAYGV